MILPKMTGYVKTFKVKDWNKDNKSMSFYINDEKLFEKCKTISTKIEYLTKLYWMLYLGLGKKEGGCIFEGGWYPNVHYE